MTVPGAAHITFLADNYLHAGTTLRVSVSVSLGLVFADTYVPGVEAARRTSLATGFWGTGEASCLSETAPGAAEVGHSGIFIFPVCGSYIGGHFHTMDNPVPSRCSLVR